jgi:hypothetical protein
MQTRHRYRTAAALLGMALAGWLTGASWQRAPARAAAPTAASPVLRHQFINNVDAAKMPPDARGHLSVKFTSPLPAAPTILLQCPNPRYSVKVHGASPTGFTYAIYHTRDLLESKAANPFDGEEAAKPVTDYKAAQNIDIAWVAIADGTAN